MIFLHWEWEIHYRCFIYCIYCGIDFPPSGVRNPWWVICLQHMLRRLIFLHWEWETLNKWFVYCNSCGTIISSIKDEKSLTGDLFTILIELILAMSFHGNSYTCRQDIFCLLFCRTTNKIFSTSIYELIGYGVDILVKQTINLIFMLPSGQVMFKRSPMLHVCNLILIMFRGT